MPFGGIIIHKLCVSPYNSGSRHYDSFGQVRKLRLKGDYERLRIYNCWGRMQTQDFEFKSSFLLNYRAIFVSLEFHLLCIPCHAQHSAKH